MEAACVDPLEKLLEEGHTAGVVELAEWVLSLTERASEHVQDSGEVGMLWDRLRALHLKACQQANPDGVALARRLFVQVTSSSYDPFPEVVETYQDHFGTAGLSAFRRLAEERLAGLPLPHSEPPEIRGDIPLKRAIVEHKQRALQLRNIQELTYRRSGAAVLLKKCLEVEARRGRHATLARKAAKNKQSAHVPCVTDASTLTL